MKTLSLIVLSALFISGCSFFSTVTRPTDPLEALRYDIDQVLMDSIFIPSDASVKIVSLATGEVLYERSSRRLFRPASNMKLLTTAAGLHYLGAEFQFKTEVIADSVDSTGVVVPNLYLKGYGNPDLRTSDLDSLALVLRHNGITAVAGDIRADISYFDSLYWGEGWMWDDEPYAYEAFISPLNVNDNCVEVAIIPGQSAGDSATVFVTPPTSYVSLQANVRTVSDTVLRPWNVTRLFMQRLNTIVAEGEVLATPETLRTAVTIWRPELYAAQLFRESLERAGIPVRGTTGVGSAPANSRVLAVHRHPIDTMIVNLNKSSDNLSAEALLKTIAAETAGAPGSASQGIRKVNEFLSGLGIDTTGHRQVDGSGLSYYNVLTTSMLVQLLEGMYRRTDLFPLFYRSLPIAGVDGTIDRRMQGTPAQGNLRAKTGTLSGVSSLSGYVRSADGEWLVFSMTMQNYISGAHRYRDAQDRIGALLAGFSRRRSFAALP